jgi:Ceramidase
MTWSEQVFRYCERGQDPGFWAEPLNAITNAAFLLAALAAAVEFQKADPRDRDFATAALIALVCVIGAGSFMFHTMATRWAGLADTLPIVTFMLGYLGYALRVYLGLGWLWTALGVLGFFGVLRYADTIPCRPGLLSVVEASGPCLNGTVGYLPAFLAMLGIGATLALQRHPAARSLLGAAGVFLVSMGFRTVDLEICALTRIGGRALGTHFLWHLLNATTLYILLRAAVRHGSRVRARPPIASPAS